MKIVGIDRGRKAWVVAESDDHYQGLLLGITEDLTGYLASLDGTDCQVVIDVPVGLPAGQSRRVDLVARRQVGRRRGSSIFPVPMRAALGGRTYEDASTINFQASGKRLSKQAYGILDGIRELDTFMTPARQHWLREGHPEVTFAILSDGIDPGRKKSADGAAARCAILDQYIDVPDIDSVRQKLGRKFAGGDDVIDALAMLVSAGRASRGEAVVLPDGIVEHDGAGLRMEIVA